MPDNIPPVNVPDEEPEIVELSWDEALKLIARRKRTFDEMGDDPFPGAPDNGVIRFDYLYALAARLKEEAEMVSVAPWPHHLQLDLELKRNGLPDRRTLITVFPMRENWYSISVARKPKGMPDQYERVGFFDLEDSIVAIKNAVRALQDDR